MPPVESAIPFSEGGVRGFLHVSAGGVDAASADALVLTHGAGSNAKSPLLVEIASVFASAGVTVLRYDLPFRQARPHGPPFPATAARDREGLCEAVRAIRPRARERLFLGGHSYGGRQSTMAAADDSNLAHALLLLSYPLHPPRKPDELRTAHFPRLYVPAFFVHGTRDPFGSVDEMRGAIALIPARTHLLEIEGAAHDLVGRRRGAAAELANRLTAEFLSFAGK